MFPLYTHKIQNTLKAIQKWLLLPCLLLTTLMVNGQETGNILLEVEQRIEQAATFGQADFCGTMQQTENQKSPKDIDINNRFMQFRNGGTWNLQGSYGGGCTNDCDLTSVERDPLSCSGAGNDIFRIPIVYTLSTTTGCPSTIPTTTELSAQIDIMNDFMICQGIPMEFYECEPARMLDLGCTYNAANVTNVPNVVNIYVFSDTGNGSTGCNGFAFLPTSTNSATTAVMSHNCYNGFVYTQGTLNCANPGLGLGIVLIHEMGHYLGLYHTHETGAVACDDPNITTDDCTTGDFIKDTDEDPDYSGGEIGCTGCNTGGATPDCAFNNSAVPACDDYLNGVNPPNTINNIMSYNNFSGCRTAYTECQKAKMIDALLCARGPQMCCRDINAEFAGGAADANLEICLGDPAPTFTATSNCYNWYDGLGAAATALATNSSTFTPTLGTGAGQLDNNTPGVYEWYLGDLNEINQDRRTKITVTVIADAGT